MASDQPLQVRLDQVLHQFSSVADLARIIGVSDNAIYKWLSGRGQPSVANLVALAKAAKVSLEWLATGHESEVNKLSLHHRNEHEDFTYPPRYDANGRASLRSEQVVDYLAFKTEWVRTRLNAEPRNLLLIEALGDSMSPTLEDRDLLLADLGERRFRHDGIYVLRRENVLEVKRLQRRPDGSLNIICDNPAYSPAVISSDGVHLIGRVIWVASRL
jgi:phage repressor protein C with HTH and peptisase S24 domain